MDIRSGVDAMYLLVVLDQTVYCVLCKLVCDLVPQNHVHVNDVGLNMDELIVEEGFHQRIAILAQFRLGRLGEHQ